jgi:NAD(P)H-hydrate epimerase
MIAEASALPLYTAAETRALDAAAMAAGMTGGVLMERAGEAAVDALCQRWPDWRRLRIAVLAGSGNNGGDGYVIARRLREAGARVALFAAADPGRLSGDAAEAAARWREAGGTARDARDGFAPAQWDLAVDALLGTGLSSEVRGVSRDLIEAVAAARLPVLAVDIPSGLDADSGRILGAAAPAALTVTFVGCKRGLFTGQGPDVSGEVRFDGLGIPAAVRAAHPAKGRLLDHESLRLPARSADSHKGRHGRVLLAGGAPGMAGALALAGRAALRAGAGWVVAGAHDDARATVAGSLAELITATWGEGGGLAEDQMARADCLGIGPGLGGSKAARALLAQALSASAPLVADADALNLLAEDPELAQTAGARPGATVLTPHPGEAARLLGTDAAAVQADRFAAAARIAEQFGAVCCLKGAGTVVAAPEGTFAVNATGNPGMAAGGQGDVLTGILAARLAQGDSPVLAAERAVWAHGAAADRVAAQRGPFGFLPSECADALPAVWAALTDEHRTTD